MKDHLYVTAAVVIAGAVSFGCSKDKDSAAQAGTAASGASAASTASTAPSAAPSAAPKPAAAATVPDACAVATSADVAAAFGETFTQAPGTPHNEGTVSRCEWKVATKLLMVRTEALDKASFEGSLKGVPGMKPVGGVGESAYFQSGNNQMFAYKGATKVSLNFAGVGVDAAKTEAAEKLLMLRIVARL
jgi:hypothetical protein